MNVCIDRVSYFSSLTKKPFLANFYANILYLEVTAPSVTYTVIQVGAVYFAASVGI